MKKIALNLLRSVNSPKLYVWLVNAYSLVTGRKLPFRFVSGGSVTYDGYYIPHFFRSTFYIYGLARRAKNIVADYSLEQVEFVENDFVIDCGANCGDLRLALSHISADKLNYLAFEPGASEFFCLNGNSERFPTIVSDLRCIGLSNIKGTMKYYQNVSSGDGSLVQTAGFDQIVEVEVDTLDGQLVDELRPVKLIKLEAEGFEPEILEGAAEVLKRTEYVVVDVGFERGVNEESTLPQVVNLLMEQGFKVKCNSKQRLTILFEREQRQ